MEFKKFSRIETLYLGPKAEISDEKRIIDNLDIKKYSFEKNTSALKLQDY